MKTIVLLLVSLMPFALLSQGKSNSVDIKKPMPSNIVVSPASHENVQSGNTLNLKVHLIEGNKSDAKLYSVRLSGLRSRSDRRLLLVKAQPILLTLSNGKVLEFKTVAQALKKSTIQNPTVLMTTLSFWFPVSKSTKSYKVKE